MAADFESPSLASACAGGGSAYELKFLLDELGLDPSTVSKYRRCREAWGVPTGREVVHA
jgi:hypothetical protein